MDTTISIISGFLFLYEFSLMFTNSLYIFYNNTSKTTKIINYINIILVILEIILVRVIDPYIVFGMRVFNTLSISYIFCKNLPDRPIQINLEERNENNQNNQNNQNRNYSNDNDLEYPMYL